MGSNLASVTVTWLITYILDRVGGSSWLRAIFFLFFLRVLFFTIFYNLFSFELEVFG